MCIVCMAIHASLAPILLQRNSQTMTPQSPCTLAPRCCSQSAILRALLTRSISAEICIFSLLFFSCFFFFYCRQIYMQICSKAPPRHGMSQRHVTYLRRGNSTLNTAALECDWAVLKRDVSTCCFPPGINCIR